MNEVINTNFEEIYHQKVKQAVENASFIAIDTEFTGLQRANCEKESLFDTVEERYQILRKNIEPYIIIQFGLTTFEPINDEKTYCAKVFNFYLRPTSYLGKLDSFSWQTSTLEFLCSLNFNFNKAFYNGISYVNEIEEATLREELLRAKRIQDIRMSDQYRDSLRSYVNKVSAWLSRKDNNKPIKIYVPDPVSQYIVQKELRRRFPNIWTVCEKKRIFVLKVDEDARKVIEQEEEPTLEQLLMEYITGFSEVFRLLVNVKKPIIGHNILLDLMYMYQQFYKPLPNHYSDFKSNIHQLFPIIFDTKHLSVRLMETNNVCWKTNSLFFIYRYFLAQQGQFLSLHSQNIVLETGTLEEEKIYHTAGWDAYFAGYIFIKMAHVFAMQKSESDRKSFTNAEIMNAVKDFANCVNIIRGNVTYTKLDGSPPSSTRPDWLLVKTLNRKVLDTAQIAEKFSSFGKVEVRPFASRQVLLAVEQHESAKDILRVFKDSEEFRVTPYRSLRHLPSARFLLWGGVVLSGGLLGWLAHKQWKNKLSVQTTTESSSVKS